MFNSTFNRDQFRPPQEILDHHCECVRVGRVAPPKVMRDWARAHCESFVWWEIEQHNDRYPVDRIEVWLFYFYREEDATAFRLKWL